jgi:hypothetical protein
MPWLFSQLDREPCSITSGSFDREHWSWKFRDFPLGMLQASVYLPALLWRHPFPGNPYYDNSTVLTWIATAIEHTLARQRSNGAFDVFSPNEQDSGTTLGVIHGLSEAFCLARRAFSETRQDRFLGALRKACDFAISRDENHAFISNHWALFAVAFLDAYELLDDEKYKMRAEEILERIMREQSSDGWYREYEGPDPGYESLGIFHLATYWRRTGSAALLKSLRRSVEFFAHCVHPDGSVGGVYGSRHTSLYFPGGFEILGSEVPFAATIAKFMRERLARRNVVTPATADAENLPSLGYTYLEACFAPGIQFDADLPSLPCESLDGIRYFADSNIALAGARQYYAVINGSKGGVCRIFNKRNTKIAYEDAGYLVRADGRRWTSQVIGVGRLVETSREDQVACATALAEVRQVMLTPAKFIFLRLLNLTLFRYPALGSFLRRLIVKRLITGKRPGPLRLTRSIKFGTNEIHFRDRLEVSGKMKVQEVFLPRSFTAVHMGSAKYFHPSELTDVLQVPVSGMARELNQSRESSREFTVQFCAISEQERIVSLDPGTQEILQKEALTQV